MNARPAFRPGILRALSLRLRPFQWLAFLALLAAGCHLSQEQKGGTVLTFDRLYDSLKQYDTTVIVLKTPAGDTLDVIFRDKVESPADLQRLQAPNWNGGIVVVSIAGIRDGVVVSQVETLFDPTDSSHDQVIVVTAEDASLSSLVSSLTLLEGDSLPLPSVTVRPPNLRDTALQWQAGPPEYLVLGPGYVKALKAGSGTLTASLKQQPSVTLSFPVTIAATVDDTIPPGAPTVRVNPAGPTRERRPTWSWSGGGGGSGGFQFQLGQSVFAPGAATVSDTTFRPSADLPPGVHVLYVRERDAAGNWSLPGSAQVEIDTAGPAAPRLVGSSPTSSMPRWTWTTGGNGGAGVYRSRLGDADFPDDAPESRDSAYALTSATSGTTYTLYVQERDAAGNWSPAGSLAIKYDLTRPTVAITAPLASGTFITAKDTVTVQGAASGPNGIATVAYALNGGATQPIAPGADGSWSVNALPVPNARTTVVKVIAADAQGNQGEAEISILRDSDIPSPPASLSIPATPTNVRTITWTWTEGDDGSAGSGLSGRYRWRLGTGAWTEVTSPTAIGVTLAEGANTFQVQEQDRAGNWSNSATNNVVLDTRPPDAVTFVGIDSSYTASATPTWSWAPSTTNGGIAEYVLRLDNGAEFAWTTTSFAPTAALLDNAVHTLTVRQRDQVPGVVGAAKSFSYRVKVYPPGAPSVRSRAGTTPNLLTNDSTFTWTTGGGGNGRFRVRVNIETAHRVTGITQPSWSLPANATDGNYTVHVSEQDDLGRWGAEGSFTIQLDRTGPQYTDIRIDGKAYLLREGFITNADTLLIKYQADGAPRQFTCRLTRNNASNPCTTSNVDALGNRTRLTRNVWRRSNVVFFTVAGAGTRDGSSWEDAASDIQAEIERAGSEGKEFWLGSGNYNQGLSLWAPKWLSVHGGFRDANLPVDTTNRIRAGTTLLSLSMMGGTPGGAFSNIYFSGLTGLSGGQEGSPVYFDDCVFKDHMQLTFSAYNHMRNSEISGVTGIAAINVSFNSNLVWEGGRITGNIPGSDNYVITNGGGSTLTFRGTVDMGSNSTTQTAIIENGGSLRIQGTVRVTTSSNVTCGSAWITPLTGATCGN